MKREERVLFYGGRGRVCCCAKCVSGGTPTGIVISILLLNLPIALLLTFDVTKFTPDDSGVAFETV